MTNKKKSQGSKGIGIKSVPEPGPEATNTVISSIPKQQGLTNAQLSGVIFVSLGISYLLEYSNAVNEGNDTNACATFFDGVDSCSPADILLIKVKLYGAISCMFLVTSAMLLCWTHEALFQRLILFLCLSPIGTTLMATFASQGVLKEGKIYKLVLTGIALLVVSLSIIVKVDLARPITSRLSSLQHIGLLSMSLLSAWEVSEFLHKGIDYYLIVSPDDISDGTNCLLSFLVVDKITISFLMLFAFFFFDEIKKRSMLFFIGLSKFGELLFQLPNLESDLRDTAAVRSMVIGSAIFVAIAALAPAIKAKRD